MKTKNKVIIGLLALGASAWVIIAQDGGGNPPDQGPPRRQRNHPPLPAVILALDTNHDGIVDANEIANAPAALKTLDKNGDGKLTIEELLGPRPRGMGRRPGPGQGPDGPPAGGDFDGPPGPPPGDQ